MRSLTGLIITEIELKQKPQNKCLGVLKYSIKNYSAIFDKSLFVIPNERKRII